MLLIIGLTPVIQPLITVKAYNRTVHVYGYLTDSVSELPVPNAKIRLSMPAGLAYTYTNINGYYSITETTPEPGPFTVRVKAEKWAYYTKTISFSSNGGSYRKDFSIVDRGKRLAVYFYDDDRVSDYEVKGWTGSYSKLMENRGYTNYFYRRPSSVEPGMNALDSRESTYDRVFIFIGGHGRHTSDDQSFTILRKWWIFQYGILSDDLRDKIEDLESQRITVVVRSCQSGDFVDELASLSGVTVMCSCRESENSDSAFSNLFFWEFAYEGKSITETYDYVYHDCSEHNAKHYHPEIDYGAQSFEYA